MESLSRLPVLGVVDFLEYNEKMKTFSKSSYITGFSSYRKKPVLVGAMQVNEPFQVETLEGVMEGKAGDYLICGIAGELYPCDRKIFMRTYVMEKK